MNNSNNKYSFIDKIQVLIANIIIFVGIALMILGSMSLSKQLDIYEEYDSQMMTILEYNEDNEVYVRYRYNNNTYRTWVHVYDLKYAISDKNEILIHINPENPAEIIYVNAFTPSIYVGCGFVILMTGGLIKSNVRKNKIVKDRTRNKTEIIKTNQNIDQNIKQNANSDRITFTARVITTSIDYSQNDNGRCPIRLVCKYEDPSTNIPYVFISEAIYADPMTITNALVYVSADRYTYENAVVDTSRIIRKKGSE